VSAIIENPRLWGPKPEQEPNLYIGVTRLYSAGETVDTYETRFGIRSIEYKSDGVWVNGLRLYLQGVCQHHDLRSLGGSL
jgi:beta-galactosidase